MFSPKRQTSLQKGAYGKYAFFLLCLGSIHLGFNPRVTKPDPCFSKSHVQAQSKLIDSCSIAGIAIGDQFNSLAAGMFKGVEILAVQTEHFQERNASWTGKFLRLANGAHLLAEDMHRNNLIGLLSTTSPVLHTREGYKIGTRLGQVMTQEGSNLLVEKGTDEIMFRFKDSGIAFTVDSPVVDIDETDFIARIHHKDIRRYLNRQGKIKEFFVSCKP